MLAIKEKHKQNTVRSKCQNTFWSQIVINFTGSALYEELLGIMSVYFILLSSITQIKL